MTETDWEDYSSEQMFPGCDCGHDATEHKAAWGDWRDFVAASRTTLGHTGWDALTIQRAACRRSRET